MATTKRHWSVTSPLFIALVLLATLATSCATLFKSDRVTQDVRVTTRPNGGEVWVDGERVGTAPIWLTLDTRQGHEVTVRRGKDIRTWQIKPHLSTAGASYLGADALVLVPATWCVVKMIEGYQFYSSRQPTKGFFSDFDLSGADLAIGAGCLIVGVTPLVVDVATKHLYELRPSEITVEFQ